METTTTLADAALAKHFLAMPPPLSGLFLRGPAPADTPACRKAWAAAVTATGTNRTVDDALWSALLSLPKRLALSPEGPMPTFWHMAQARLAPRAKGINTWLSFAAHDEGWGVGYAVFPDGEGGRPICLPYSAMLSATHTFLAGHVGWAEEDAPSVEQSLTDPMVMHRVFGDSIIGNNAPKH